MPHLRAVISVRWETGEKYQFTFTVLCSEKPIYTILKRYTLLLPTVVVTLDQIQSNGGFPSKQKMMYSLPGDRKATRAQRIPRLDDAKKAAVPSDSNIAPLLLHWSAQGKVLPQI